MPESGAGDRGPGAAPDAGGEVPADEVRRELDRLAEGVARLLEAYDELWKRAARAEAAQKTLSEAFAATELEGLGPEEAQERFQELAEENRRLRRLVEEGRERAERIRSRLVMMEDEL